VGVVVRCQGTAPRAAHRRRVRGASVDRSGRAVAHPKVPAPRGGPRSNRPRSLPRPRPGTLGMRESAPAAGQRAGAGARARSATREIAMSRKDRSRRGRRRFLAAVSVLAAAIAVPWRARGATSARGARMKIGIVGSGQVGGTLGAVWVKAGHEVMFSSRTLEDDRALAARLGPNAHAGTPRAAAAFGEVVMVSVPYHALPEVGRQLADLIAGKVVIDTCNPFLSRDGE